LHEHDPTLSINVKEIILKGGEFCSLCGIFLYIFTFFGNDPHGLMLILKGTNFLWSFLKKLVATEIWIFRTDLSYAKENFGRKIHRKKFKYQVMGLIDLRKSYVKIKH
jgi:hypothetical protein